MLPMTRSTLRFIGKSLLSESRKMQSMKRITAPSGARAWVASRMARFMPAMMIQRSLKPRRYSSMAAKMAVLQKPARKGAVCMPWKRPS